MHPWVRFTNKTRPVRSARELVLAVGLGCSLAGAWHCSPIFANRVVSSLAFKHVSSCSRIVTCGRQQGSVPGGGGEAWIAADGIGSVDGRCFRALGMRDSCRRGIVNCCGAPGADERDGPQGGDYNAGDGGDQGYDSDFYYDVAGGVEDGHGDEPQLDDGRDVDTFQDDDDHFTEHGRSNDGRHQNIHDRGGGEGDDDEAEGDGDDDDDMLGSSTELIEALIEGEADISESFKDHSLALDDDRVVGEIARPVMSYYKRYKSPRVEYAKRQEARRRAEKDPFYSAFDCKGSDDGAKSGVDIISRYGRISKEPPEGYDEQGPIFEGMPRREPDRFSERSHRARERWRDPVYRMEQLSKRKKPYASRKPESMKPEWMRRLTRGLDATPETVVTVDDVDNFLTNNKITAEEAVRFHSVAIESEQRRMRGIYARYENQKWVDDRVAKGKTIRANLNNPVFYEDRKAARSLKAKKAYEVRRRNGNGGYKPNCPLHRERMAKRAAAAAVAAAEMASGVKQHKRGQGGPAKHEDLTEGVAETLQAWMAAAAVKAAQESGLSNSSAPDLGTDIAALSISRTKDLLLATAAEKSAAQRAGLGAGTAPQRRKQTSMDRALALGIWTTEMSSIAVAGVEAWRQAWDQTIADAAASAAAADIDAMGETAVGGSGEGNVFIKGGGANVVGDAITAAPRRRRGRPPKIRAATEVPTSETSGSSVEMAATSDTLDMPRRRGRPRKIRTAND